MSGASTISLAELRAAREPNRFLQFTGWSLLLLCVVSWGTGGFVDGLARLISPDRITVFQRFLHELLPLPLQKGHSSDLITWLHTLLSDKTLPALWKTLLFASASASVAFVFSCLLAPWASRTFATPRILDLALPQASWLTQISWRLTYLVTRSLLMVCRALPEYLLTFLFIALWGPTGWAAIAALAIHNIGVMGRLYSELLENADSTGTASLAQIGGSRLQVLMFGAAPVSFGRAIAYWFYRWETCVRDSVTLGMLGISSLGFWIMDARVRDLYDEMFLLMLASASLVLAGEAVSNWVRKKLRSL